jgi:hypothetical protein
MRSVQLINEQPRTVRRVSLLGSYRAVEAFSGSLASRTVTDVSSEFLGGAGLRSSIRAEAEGRGRMNIAQSVSSPPVTYGCNCRKRHRFAPVLRRSGEALMAAHTIAFIFKQRGRDKEVKHTRVRDSEFGNLSGNDKHGVGLVKC